MDILSSNSYRSDVYWLDQNGKKYFGESSIEKDSKNRYEVKNTLTIKASYEIHQGWIDIKKCIRTNKGWTVYRRLIIDSRPIYYYGSHVYHIIVGLICHLLIFDSAHES